MYVLLAEKPSAAKSFAAALGGMSGTFEGQPYKVVSLVGHLLEFTEPHEMVPEEDKDLFAAWEAGTMPWDTSKLQWTKKPRATKDRSGRASTMAKKLSEVKQEVKGASAVVIATDKDPSGEGQLIGWEVIQHIGWSGPVKRLYFLDESKKSLQNGFRNIEDLPGYNQDGEYLKADVRSRWDFVSMQLTRLATTYTREAGYNTVVRSGRLKSVMVKFVADQLKEIKAYKKKPYYEVKYKDDKGNVFSRTFNEGDTFRYNDKSQAESNMAAFKPSSVVVDSKTRKQSAPGKLLDLGSLSSILSAKGFKSKEVLATYQKMYQAKLVSYPRTEDKFISHEQFKEMLPLVDNIAKVVGADTSLLTHRKPRPTHVKDGGAHGANRPGLVIPTSLKSLATMGPSAIEIYTILAKNFLAMFGEDYQYDSIKARIKDYPEFTATVSIPVDLGFKAIFDADKETSDDEDDTVSQGVGSSADPHVAEGVNKKPPHPTQKWLEKQLSRYDVGTGATRVSTLSEVTSGKLALMTETKGKLGLTPTGEIASVLLEGSHIGSPDVTAKLFKMMKDVGDKTITPDKVLETVNTVVEHDKAVFKQNAARLKEVLGDTTIGAGYKVKPKVSGVYVPTGEKVTFNKEWGGYTFTDQEIEQLLNGKALTVTGVSSKTGKPFKVAGVLKQGAYKGKPFWGFTSYEADDLTRETAQLPDEWSGYTFTDQDKQVLRKGDKIKIKAVSKKTGKPFECDVSFDKTEYKGQSRWGIVPHFEERPDASKQTRETAKFKPEFSGYKLNEEEIAAVRRGEQVMITPTSKKTGKSFTCNVSLELKTFKGSKFWGLEPHFK